MENQIKLFSEQFEHFEDIWQKDENGVEFIYARDLQKELGYSTWQKFQTPINRAVESCVKNNNDKENHFNHMVKMVDTGSGASREIEKDNKQLEKQNKKKVNDK